jgi:hypothetical protein
MLEEQGKRRVPPGLQGAIIALALAWIALLVILSRLHTAQPQREQAVLPIYPKAYAVDVKELPDRGWRSANYLVPLDYPSTDVFTYYDDHMKEQGWSRDGKASPPEWRVSRTSSGETASLMATWISPSHLQQLDLQLVWEKRKGEEGESENPRQTRVIAVISRTVVPFSGTPEGGRKTKGETPLAK